MTLKKQGLELEQIEIQRIAKDLEMLPDDKSRTRVLGFVNAHQPSQDYSQTRLAGT